MSRPSRPPRARAILALAALLLAPAACSPHSVTTSTLPPGAGAPDQPSEPTQFYGAAAHAVDVTTDPADEAASRRAALR